MENNKLKENNEESIRNGLLSLYKEKYRENAEIARLPGAGSDRRYYRLTGESGRNAVGTYGEDRKEDRCFIELSKIFRGEGVNVPEVWAEDVSAGIYIQEDLGMTDLLNCLKGSEKDNLVRKSLRELVKMQKVDCEKWRGIVINKPFSARMVRWDLNYFKYSFLKPAGIAFEEERLEDDFEHLTSDILTNCKDGTGFMYRDFQSRNVMIKEGEPYFIDYQGGREGPMVYDAVSFLWQAKAGFTEEERQGYMDYYLNELSGGEGVDKFRKSVDILVLLRTLQVLGAYGFRGLIEKKSHFIESIPAALRNLAALKDCGVLKVYPELERVAGRCVESRFAGEPLRTGLTVKVFSFSYKKGYPEDLSGNGGGFMFDCRGMHNPGRYAEYKTLTGLDAPVRIFLEERGEVQEFVRKVVELVSPTVERYYRRGFTGLQVGFGCTGGQHRSVYCADAFSERISELFPGVRVEVEHREQGVREVKGKS